MYQQRPMGKKSAHKFGMRMANQLQNGKERKAIAAPSAEVIPNFKEFIAPVLAEETSLMGKDTGNIFRKDMRSILHIDLLMSSMMLGCIIAIGIFRITEEATKFMEIVMGLAILFAQIVTKEVMRMLCLCQRVMLCLCQRVFFMFVLLTEEAGVTVA